MHTMSYHREGERGMQDGDRHVYNFEKVMRKYGF